MDLAEFKNPFEVNDFSGGMTDDVFLQDPRRSKTIDNLYIKSDRSLDSRDGSDLDDYDEPIIPAGNQRIGTLINYANSDKLFVHSSKKLYYRNPSAYATLQGPTGNDLLSVGDTTNMLSHTQWNGHLYITSDAFPRPMKVYKDSTNAYRLRSMGLPSLASSPTVTAGAAGLNEYIYSFHYEYTYTVNDRTFQDYGTVTQVALSLSGDPGINPNSITGIPVLANGAEYNWDTTTIRIFIYRTIAGGQDSYLLGNVTNGTTIFNDNFSDSAIIDNDRLYIDDGTLDFDEPPLSKFIHVVNNTGYYAHIKVGSDIFKNTIRQSIPGDPDSVPEAFDIIVEDEITGLSSARSVPIVLCKRHIYRIEQFYDQFGRGVPLPVRISDTAGCISNLSIVQAENGIYWFGNDGVYATDGYQTMKISDGNNENYKAFIEASTQVNRIYGRFDEKERRIYWAIQRDSASLDNDSFLVLDLRNGPSPDMPFYTFSGDSFRPSAIEFFNKQLYRADTRGYVFIHDDTHTTDPKVDTNESPDDWVRETIIWTYESINYNFGQTALRKYVTKILLTASNRNNTSIQITATNDDGKKIRELKQIRWRRNFVWGDEDFVWGSEDCVWNAVGLIEQWRRMPAKGLRLSYLQVKISNAFSVIVNSDTIGTSTFDNTAKTITLDDAVDQDWPTDSVDYVIKTEVDNYQREFIVSERTPNTLTVLDPDNMLPMGSLKWELYGYKKGEPLNLLSYNLYWDANSDKQLTFEAGQDGGNA